MWLHKHPYDPYIPRESTRLIVGTLPPPRFSQGLLNDKDIDFCYGSSNGLLWKAWNIIYTLNLEFANTQKAIEQRKAFLKKHKIGICDIVESGYRDKIDASDLGLQQVVLRDMFKYLKENPRVNTLIFTGGNSKNGPEYFFRKLTKEQNIKLHPLDEEVPRKYSFHYLGKKYQTISLTAPSGSANRAIGSMKKYKERKAENPKYSPFDFRVEQYSKVFKSTE